MVSAKFNIAGEDGEWFRLRLQEEIHHHGLEGSVLHAASKALVVVVEGDKAAVKRFHADVLDICPSPIRCGDLTFSVEGPLRGLKAVGDGRRAGEPTMSQILDILAEMERKITRMDQNIQKLAAARQGRREETPEEKPSEIGDEAASAFSSIFGN